MKGSFYRRTKFREGVSSETSLRFGNTAWVFRGAMPDPPKNTSRLLRSISVLVIAFARAGAAQAPAVFHNIALEIYPLAAFGAHHPRPLEPRQILRLHRNFHPFLVKQNIVRKLRV